MPELETEISINSSRTGPRIDTANQPGEKLAQLAHIELSAYTGKELLTYLTEADVLLTNGDTSEALLSTYDAVNQEIARREHKNITNRGFYLFLTGHKSGNQETQEEGYRILRRITDGIVYEEHHWRHPGAPDIWIYTCHDVLLTEQARYGCLNLSEIGERLLDNGFAYLYTAIERECYDVWRKFYRNREALRGLEATDRARSIEQILLEEAHAEASAKGFEELALKFQSTDPAYAEILRQSARYRRDPEGFMALYGPHRRLRQDPVSFALKRAAAEARGVGIRRGQQSFKAMCELAKFDLDFQALKAQLQRAAGDVNRECDLREQEPALVRTVFFDDAGRGAGRRG